MTLEVCKPASWRVIRRALGPGTRRDRGKFGVEEKGEQCLHTWKWKIGAAARDR